MSTLDFDFLARAGLGELPDDAKRSLLQATYASLEDTVGTVLAEDLTDAQLDAFCALTDAGDDEGALEWLETNVAHYKKVVRDEIERTEVNLRARAAEILASVQDARAIAPGQTLRA